MKILVENVGNDPEFPDGVRILAQVGTETPQPLVDIRTRCCMYASERSNLIGLAEGLARVCGFEVVKQ